MTLVNEIKVCIEKSLKHGRDKFVICAFGDVGMQVKQVLNQAYGIQEDYILDNHLYEFNPSIKPVSFLKTLDCSQYTFVMACLDPDAYEAIKSQIIRYAGDCDSIYIAPIGSIPVKIKYTETGKYSYGPLINHALVKSVGAFTSIARGCAVVPNHPMSYITTHSILYQGGDHELAYAEKNIDIKKGDNYFGGVAPKGRLPKTKQITIGNDVWLGINTIITNGSNIGNGVISGAGSVITKDVPDYAIVVGAPARIIRYRYLPDQIEQLNKIAWWDWPDEVIRERFDDLYLPIEEFLLKYRI